MQSDPSYEKIPYDSTPYPDARPATLAALAHLHGLRTAPATNCSVLELGCASGGHLIPLAWHHPGSEFIGVDLSGRQITDGQRLVDGIGLANCRLQQADVLELQFEAHSFDYIIAHGLISWVSPDVRGGILQQVKRLLRPHGVAYLSYNALPGWHSRAALRDLLLWHTRDQVEPLARLEQAQKLMQLMAPALPPTHPMAADIQRASTEPTSSLAHDFLEANNHALHLWEFAEEADNVGLQYICDAALHTGMASFYGEGAETLVASESDPVSISQYLDFISDRAFRQSLLCHQHQSPLPLDVARIKDCLLLSDREPAHEIDLGSAQPQNFVAPNGQTIEIQHPLAVSAMQILSDSFPVAMPCAELLVEAQKMVAKSSNQKAADQIELAKQELFTLAAFQQIDLLLENTTEQKPTTPEKPQANQLARAHAQLGWSHTATIHHRTFSLDEFIRELLLRLDGSRDRKQLIEDLQIEFAPGGRLAGLNTANHSPETLSELIGANVDRVLRQLVRNHLLMP